MTLLLAAYILSPIDIIPDLVFPGLGYIDDIVLIPFVAELIQKMIPRTVASDLNLEAVHLRQKTKSLIVVLLFAGILLALLLVYRYLRISF